MSQETIIELSRTIAALSEENERWKAHSKVQDDHYSAGVKALQAESDGYFNERNAALSKLQEAQDTIGGLRAQVEELIANRKAARKEVWDRVEELENSLKILTNYTDRFASALTAFKTVRFPKSRRKGITVEVETVAGSKRRFTFTTAAHRAHAILLAHQTIYRDEAKASNA